MKLEETRHVCNMIYVRNQLVTAKKDFLHLIFLVGRWTHVANFWYICARDLYALCLHQVRLGSKCYFHTKYDFLYLLQT